MQSPTGVSLEKRIMRSNQFTIIGLLVLVCAAATNAMAFYNPQTGRWLSRDPIGEGGGLNDFGFTRNAPVNFTDMLGLDIQGPEDPCNQRNVTVVTSYHGSVEITGDTINYINTDDPGMESASVSRSAASIDRQVTGAIHAHIHASTQPHKLFRPRDMQMSTSLGGYIRLGVCCPSGRIKMRWSIAANIYAGTPATVGGAHVAYASIGGHSVLAMPQRPSQFSGGEETLGSSERVPFSLGQGWIDQDMTGTGVFSTVEVTTLFSCASK